MRLNLYSPDELRIWFRSYLDGDDVSFEEYDHRVISLGEPPEWLRQLDDSLVEMFDPGCYLADYKAGWHLPRRALFLLCHGIAPGQPFYVSLKPPQWYRCGEYGEEWDVEYDYDVIGQANWTNHQKAKAWKKFLRSAPASQELERQIREREKARHQKAVKYMRVSFVAFGGHYDDYIPDQQRAELYSALKTARNRYQHYNLACGGDVPIHDDKEALDSLFENVQKCGIPLTREQLDKLPRTHR